MKIIVLILSFLLCLSVVESAPDTSAGFFIICRVGEEEPIEKEQPIDKEKPIENEPEAEMSFSASLFSIETSLVLAEEVENEQANAEADKNTEEKKTVPLILVEEKIDHRLITYYWAV